MWRIIIDDEIRIKFFKWDKKSLVKIEKGYKIVLSQKFGMVEQFKEVNKMFDKRYW